jgi:hypothetical protein
VVISVLAIFAASYSSCAPSAQTLLRLHGSSPRLVSSRRWRRKRRATSSSRRSQLGLQCIGLAREAQESPCALSPSPVSSILATSHSSNSVSLPSSDDAVGQLQQESRDICATGTIVRRKEEEECMPIDKRSSDARLDISSAGISFKH